MGTKIDLTNQKFGRLLVLKEDGRDNSNRIMWLCRCDCGNEVRVRGNDLRGGKIQSCGCLGKEKREEALKQKRQESKNKVGYYKDLTGQKFNRLLVLNFDEDFTLQKKMEKSKSTGSYWKCQCDCGNLVSVLGTELVNGHTKSCGCLRKESAEENMRIIQKLGVASRFNDLTGQKFGKLTVLTRVENRGQKVAWKCQCDCGRIIETTSYLLTSGQSQSCGCLGKS